MPKLALTKPLTITRGEFPETGTPVNLDLLTLAVNPKPFRAYCTEYWLVDTYKGSIQCTELTSDTLTMIQYVQTLMIADSQYNDRYALLAVNRDTLNRRYQAIEFKVIPLGFGYDDIEHFNTDITPTRFTGLPVYTFPR